MSNISLQEFIQMVNNAEEQDKWIKAHFNDKNCFKKIYDRNKAIRVFVATQNGKNIGTCVEDNLQHYRTLKEQGLKPKLYQTDLKNELNYRWLFHQFITITINGKKYMESKSNGRHIRVPYYNWAKVHTFRNKRQVHVDL